MMHIKYMFLVIPLFLGCSNEPQTKPLDYSQVIIQKDTTFSEKRTIEVQFSYPNTANPLVNQEIHTFLGRDIYSERIFSSFDELWEAFKGEYSRLMDSGPWHSAGWNLTKEVTILMNRDDIIVLKLDEMQFTGGVHPLTTISFLNLDLKDTNRLTLDDLFREGYEVELNKIGEQYFRRLVDIDDTTPLHDLGFMFPEDKFSTNENFALTESGLQFYYNSYEIASYASGPTTLLIPYEELWNLFIDSSYCKRLTKTC